MPVITQGINFVMYCLINSKDELLGVQAGFALLKKHKKTKNNINLSNKESFFGNNEVIISVRA